MRHLCSFVVACSCALGPWSARAEEPFPPWTGREAVIEAVLLHGEVVAKERVGHGITNPWQVTLEHRGERLVAVWKPLPERVESGHHESYRAEVAAYRLSRMLGLGMVPPTVLRQVGGRPGSMQLWVEGCRLYVEAVAHARPPLRGFSEQTARMRFFDALIDNPDRNARNFLVDDAWRFVLIDHSRALSLPAISRPRPQRDAPPFPARFDRDLLAATRALDIASLDAVLGDLYGKAELRTLLRQRDALLRRADEAWEQFGDSALFGGPPIELAAAGCAPHCVP